MGALDFMNAFKRNCPDVRMTKDEEQELWRLFLLARTEAEERAYEQARTQQR